MKPKVIKCICSGVKFSRLKEIAEQTNSKSFIELGKHAQFAHNCKRCLPYIGRMLETGQVEFAPLTARVHRDEKMALIAQSEPFGDEEEL